MTPSQIVKEEMERQIGLEEYRRWNDEDMEQVALRCMERWEKYVRNSERAFIEDDLRGRCLGDDDDFWRNVH